jgi:ribonuclease P protein component
MTQRLRRARRLRVRADFERVFRGGRRQVGRLFVMVGKANGAEEHRLGIATGRRVGGAVARSRARRLVRESFRRLDTTGEPGHDLVIVARAELATNSQAEVDREFTEGLRCLLRRRRAGRAPAAARD